MNTEDKRKTAYGDLDRMPFGKHKGTPLQDVDPKYLLWLWDQRPLSDKKLEDYIYNSMEALKMEVGDR